MAPAPAKRGPKSREEHAASRHDPHLGLQTANSQLDAAKKAASSLGLEVTTWDASSADELGRLLSTVSAASVDAVLSLTDPMLSVQRERIVLFAAENRLPGFYFWREFVEAGGLMSYGPNLIDMHRSSTGIAKPSAAVLRREI
jgi:putative tryptophan/tyrosine transport system substrate-binding protein